MQRYVTLCTEMAESEYACLLGGKSRSGTRHTAAEFSYSNTVLMRHNVHTKGISEFLKSIGKKETHFLKNEETLKEDAADTFSKLERWYVEHTTQGLYKGERGLKEHLDRLLTIDPVGLTDPPKDDEYCWTPETLTTMATGSATAGRRTRSASATTASATGTPSPAVTQTYRATQLLINLRHCSKET